ncbi:leucyl aminopeptidase [Synechococcales cyanobacterium C]|uniref:Probable cytosol aminopeptidase n=1 Tax=Petrachloros mirabilis ULC683 TaxID=2781853 RepID=A0A8K1ZX95_9CYAN|nr:leucyl aminopeptidase [Petrachloros mirabilis]NCJ05791.1 leucyl aminopeptidase [Petrachloros mirabilis ULC683]
MKIQATDIPTAQWSGDCLALGFFAIEPESVTLDLELDQHLGGLLKELIQETNFKGKVGETQSVRLASGTPRQLILVGLGESTLLSLDTLRQAAAAVARIARKQRCQTVGLQLPPWNQETASSAQAISEGIELALHQDHRFKSEPDLDSAAFPSQIELLGLGHQTAALERAQQVCSGVILARELVAAPANIVTPVTLADTATELAQTYNLSLEILEREDCENLGMGAFLGVAQASDLPPKFIHLTYKPSGVPRRKLAIIGKGLTFDSGGLNLKVSGSGIETMKMDMGGSAAAFGAAKVIGQIQPDVEVHFIVAATENMISGHAMRPGDILTASNGKTIEVNNTDAEGRLTLADALVFAEKLGVEAIVDLATLTGACIVALGDDIAGLWSSEDQLAQALTQAAELAGEKFWKMPLEEKYFEGLKSPVADMKNTGPRSGGSITAALFLKQFVKDTAWAHLDVAGPVWADKESGYINAGGTGFGVRTLVNWALS